MEQHIWTQAEHEELLKLKKQKYTYQQIADRLSFQFNRPFTKDGVRNRLRRTKGRPTLKEAAEAQNINAPEERRRHPDGTRSSKKVIEIDEQDEKDDSFLLQAHGYDDSWEIIESQSSKWNQHNKEDGTVTLYSSKIRVKQKAEGFNWDKFVEVVKNPPQIHRDTEYIPDRESYINVPLFDMHFRNRGDYEHYKPTQAKILHLLDKGHKETLLIIGSDLFHHNDHRNRTASGREIEHADMTIAWEEAVKFYEPIIEKALKTSEKVYGMFIRGNHSESLEWCFCKYLEARFPQIVFDTDFKERKVHMMGNVMVAATHGDKNKLNKLNELFSTEFPIQWSKAKTRECLTGHLHHERVEDKGGLVLRQLSTRNKVDQYHEDYGYTASHKRFQVFEYSRDELKTIHYV